MAGVTSPTQPAKPLKVRDAVASWDTFVDARETTALIDAMQKALDHDRPLAPPRPASNLTVPDAQTLKSVVSFYHKLKTESEASAAVYRRGRQRLSSLSATKDVVSDMIGRVHSICNRMDSLISLNHFIAESTDQIRESCQLLAREKEQLVSQSNYLSYVLSQFDDSRRLSHRLSLTNVVSPQEWAYILNRIEDCISFMMKHQDYSEAKWHLAQFQQLRTQALSKHCMQFQKILQSSVEGTPVVLTDHFSISLLSFRSACTSARPLIAILEQKSTFSNEYSEALQECVQAYYQIRQKLLYDSSSQYIASLSESKSLPDFSRTASIYLIRICSVEARLFADFFSEESSFSMFLQLVSSVSSSLYVQIRSRIIVEEDLDVLSDVINIIQCEILDDEVSPRGDEVNPIIPVLHRVIEDVQERLIYRAGVFIRDIISGFSPGPDDLNYPDKLIAAAEKGPVSLSWYPTLESCLLLLSKIFRSVERHVFEVVAQDAISACIRSLRIASKRLPSQDDSFLFLIRHLAILKEQISPFNLGGGLRERELDLSHVTGSFRLLISGHLPALTLTETEINSQLALETELKHICELYIDHAVRVLVQIEMPAIGNQQGAGWDPAAFQQAYHSMQDRLALYFAGSKKTLEPIRNQMDHLISEVRQTVRSNNSEQQ